MNTTKRFRQVIGFTLAVLLLVGCRGAQVEPIGTRAPPSPTSQPAPTATSNPTRTPLPPATPEPTETSEPTAPVSFGETEDFEQAVDELITPFVEDGYFSGSVLVAQGENILISKGYGMANLEHDVPNTPQTKFRVGSITKQFTAMAILLLQEQGQLSVQDPICDHIPDCPEAWQPMTIHHLLTHSSGIPEEITRFSEYLELRASPPPVEDRLKRVGEKPLIFTPGSRFEYSDTGYVVLGYIIEQVSGRYYGGYLREHIFQTVFVNRKGTHLTAEK